MKEIYAAQAGENADAAVAEDANRAVGGYRSAPKTDDTLERTRCGWVLWRT